MSYSLPPNLNFDPSSFYKSPAANLTSGLGGSSVDFGNIASTGFNLAGSLMPSLTGGSSSGTAPWAQGLKAAGGLAATFGGPWGAAAGIGANLIAGLFGAQRREDAREQAMSNTIGANIFNRQFADLSDFNTEQRKIALAGSPAAKRVFGRDFRTDLATTYSDPFTRAFAARGSGATF